MSDCAARQACVVLLNHLSYNGECVYCGCDIEANEPHDGKCPSFLVRKGAATPCPPAALALTRQQENYIKNLRFYADQARSNDWHTDGRIIDWRVIRETLIECADALERVSGAERVKELEAALRSLRDAVQQSMNEGDIRGVCGSLEAALTHADAVLAKEAQ